MRGDDQRGLPARPGHVVGVARHGERARGVEPEEAAVDRPAVGLPGGGDGADELGPALRQDPFAVPHAVLQVEVAEPGPVAGRGELVPLQKIVAVGVGLEHHAADADLVEQLALRERKIVVAATLDAQPDEVVGQHRVRVAVAADGVRRPLRRAGRRPLERVDGAGVHVEVIGIAEVGVEVGVGDAPEAHAARHPQDVGDADPPARVALGLPFRHRRRLPQVVDALLNQDPHQGRGQALAHRPALQRGVQVDARAVTLGDDAPPVGRHERRGHPFRRLERRVRRLRHLRGVHALGERRGRQRVAHRPHLRPGVGQGTGDVDRVEEHVVFADGQRDAAVVAVELRRPHDAVGQGQVHPAPVAVDLDRRDVRAVLVGAAEEAHVLGRELGVEAGDEDGRAEGLGETGGVVRERVAGRGFVLGVELGLGRTGQHRLPIRLGGALGDQPRGE